MSAIQKSITLTKALWVFMGKENSNPSSFVEGLILRNPDIPFPIPCKETKTKKFYREDEIMAYLSSVMPKTFNHEAVGFTARPFIGGNIRRIQIFGVPCTKKIYKAASAAIQE